MSAAVVIESTDSQASSVTKPVTGMAALCTAALLASIEATLGYIQMNYQWQLEQWQEQSKMVEMQAAQTKAAGLKDADATRDSAIGQMAGAGVNLTAATIGFGAGYMAERENPQDSAKIENNNTRIQNLQDPQNRGQAGQELSVEQRRAVELDRSAASDRLRTPEQQEEMVTELRTDNTTRQNRIEGRTNSGNTWRQGGMSFGKVGEELAQGIGGVKSAEDKVAKARKDAQLAITQYLANMFSSLAQESSSNVSTNKSTNATLSQLLASIAQADSVRI